MGVCEVNFFDPSTPSTSFRLLAISHCAHFTVGHISAPGGRTAPNQIWDIIILKKMGVFELNFFDLSTPSTSFQLLAISHSAHFSLSQRFGSLFVGGKIPLKIHEF